ncbi:MAG TPA: PAS domain-containing sensor histidine kinase [Acidimicrobiia bacterium]|nr:PAS domain-containing sensor histidine kinase [Acidimicrobiia bacterium]
MASRAVQALLASHSQSNRPHRIVVRVGATASWFVAVIFLATGALNANEARLIEAIGPILAASLMSLQILVGREDGGAALLGSGLIVAIWYTVFGDAETVVPAAVALVLIAALGMVFVTRHRMLVASTLGGALFAMPHLWDLAVDQRVVLGVIMALSFLVIYIVLGTIQTASAALHDRYQMLFEQSPSAMLEEDWSEAVEYVRCEYSGKTDRVRHFFLAYPTVVRRAVSKAKIVRANDAALTLLDISNPARFLGYRSAEIVTEENLESFVSALVCLYEGGTSWQREVPIRGRDGELRWLLYRSVDTSTGTSGRSIVTGLADITHMKAKNDAMAEVVRAKDEFIANVSHELRTPLTAVIGLASELAGEDIAPEMRSEMLRLVSEQASEMSNIVEDLLVAARAEVGIIPVDSRPVDLLTELRATIEGLGISIDMPKKPVPAVFADPKRVRQILRNLVTNAQRYGGPQRRVVAGSIQGHVWLEVRDNGNGIPDEQADRIFQPYVSTGADGSVGLGLAVARQLAELMGGTLVYEHSAAETVFRLQLPAAEQREPALASHIHRA